MNKESEGRKGTANQGNNQVQKGGCATRDEKERRGVGLDTQMKGTNIDWRVQYIVPSETLETKKR
jgi:hypothetical protein